MKAQRFEIGMIGLGVMGRNLLLNMADHGHSVAGYDKDAANVAALRQEAENRAAERKVLATKGHKEPQKLVSWPGSVE
jgi:6-phosphogluconate dehydrogenase